MGAPRPGGQTVTILNPLRPDHPRKGTVLEWTSYGSPRCVMDDNHERRAFPQHWVVDVQEVDSDLRVAKGTAALWGSDKDLCRTRWGTEVAIEELEVLTRFTLQNLTGSTMAELTDTIIIAMMISEPDGMPMICSAVDEPADDDHIETLVQIILDAAGLPYPEPGIREE